MSVKVGISDGRMTEVSAEGLEPGAQVITDPRTPEERWLLDTVTRQAQAAGIGMPEVAIYDAPDLNAFATGMNKGGASV